MFMRTRSDTTDVHLQTKHLTPSETEGHISLSGVNANLRFEFTLSAEGDQRETSVTLRAANDDIVDAVSTHDRGNGSLRIYATDGTLAAVFEQHHAHHSRISFQTAFMKGDHTQINQDMLLRSLGVSLD